ncbi:metalloregulator ArsR/SmtB family transcription factor [Fictibacillus sp. b24]|uniref:ArsR/SmtB family transcription factor n=1 Tax=Fictibacillus sp. b24 TaxID=3055863 RepID=UPI0025A0F4B6|nr:metalloregulator ArsR/SmtB family transcription factor [Fictibacillus sp. b24]MDM5317269.1 metalloregulator ArsR/SmtB family transcription factor [Fictibacillus sp. b24]
MKNIYSPLPQEKVSISIEFSPVWEIALGIAGYTHSKLRHTFESDEKWADNKSSMTTTLVNNLKEMEQTNLWYGLLVMQNHLSASTVQDFSNAVSELEPEVFYETLLPYKDRFHETSRKETARNYENTDSFFHYASLFENHEYLEGYVQTLGKKKRCEIIELFVETMSEWYEWIRQQVEWEKWMQALAFEKKQPGYIDAGKPVKEIERITGGAKYLPEPSIWQIKLIPHVSYRPWILEQRTSDTKLLFYPLNEEALLEPGTPPQELVHGHKALGDELRLKLLYQLIRGPLSLQELTVQFNVSKTTLHHQLSLLKAAKFVKVEKGIYSANNANIQSFSKRLNQYLGEQL